MFQTPKGTRDFLPEEMIKRQYVLDSIRNVFEKWGFDPLKTPAFEDWELLAAKSGEDVKNEIYYFKDKADRELGLRFDLTVPLSRVVAMNPNIPKPFRRYQMDPVWRYDNPGSGRYREFIQCDIDVVGSESPEADALVVVVACDALKTLGFRDFVVKINSRKILTGFLQSLDVKNADDVFRSMDKLEKFGEDVVVSELKTKGVDERNIKLIIEFARTDFEEVYRLVKGEEVGKQGIEELKKVFESIESLGFGQFIKFDPSLVRGLGYYTGPVFEIVTKDSKLSIAGGGRYDNLVSAFGGKQTPATGISLGVERIINIMQEKGMLDIPRTLTKIFVANVSDKERNFSLGIAKSLIANNIPTEFDVMDRNLKKQLDYVNSKAIPFVIVIGNKEVGSMKAMLRDMKSGEEKEIDLDELSKVKDMV